jgi:ABC-2 type transport system ATP-binding protein
METRSPVQSGNTPPVIEVTNLTKRYKKANTNAVDGISFNVQQGELFALLGPNGAGKTTTISILTTTLIPTSGTARIVGYDVGTQSSQVRRNVGIIFQNPSLDLNLTAEENIRFHAVLYGLYGFRPTYASMPSAYHQQVEHLAEILGLKDDLFKPIKAFSGGMKRKLEIMRSLIHNPKVLFLDEPTVGLDPASRRNLWDYIAQVRARNNTTVLLTTHYLEEAEQSDTICIINKGKVAAYGSPDQLKSALVESSHLLIDAENREALCRELTQRGIAFEEQAGEKGELKVLLGARSAQEIIKMIDTPLCSIKTRTPSLEDAYLSIIDGEQEQDGATRE